MEKGKSRANGGQGKGSSVKLKGGQDKAVNFKSEPEIDQAPQASNHNEGGANRQLATFQDSSRTSEGRGVFGSDMFEDPFFKDPFFTRPFGEPFKSNGLLGPEGVFNHEMFDMGRWPGNLLDQFQFSNPPSVFQNGRNVPIEGVRGGREQRNVQIEELSKHHSGLGSGAHRSNQEPIVEHPDDNNDNRGISHFRSQHLNSSQSGPPWQSEGNQGNSCSFYSSSVMCRGSNGPYYASQTTRRQGPNGVVEEEHQEKDGASGRASHRVSHGLGEKGHSLVRQRKQDGQEERFQTLHNLGEDEVPQFETAWERAAETSLPKWPKNSSSQQGSSIRSQPRPALPGGSTRSGQRH